MSANVRLHLMLGEIWTMTDPRDLRRVVEFARVAEETGISGVLVGEHIAMGPDSCADGAPENPRDFLTAHHQPPLIPQPASLPLISAMASVTSTLQLVAGAVLSVLRHPLVMAKEFATVDLISRGRLVVVPAVSWQREEYDALDVDFTRRGKMLDEQLEIWQRLWNEGSPVSHDGRHYRFSEMYSEPSPYRSGGPDLWIAGKVFSPWMLRRTVAYGRGLFPIVPPTEDQFAELADEMKAAGRDISELEIAGVLPGPGFTDATGVLDLDAAIANAPAMVSKGYSTLFIKPSQFIDDSDQLADFCRTALRKLTDALSG